MLFLHETHKVVGARDVEFEAAYREGWMPALAADDDARLLWYTNHAHGSGMAYNVVTITAITDGAAWERLARRTQTGDLNPWMRELDRLRHDVTAKMLLPVNWSPLQTVDLAAVPTDGATHPLSLFMEDTGWPSAPLDRLHPNVGRDLLPAAVQSPTRHADPGYPGVFPSRSRQLPTTRSHAVAED